MKTISARQTSSYVYFRSINAAIVGVVRDDLFVFIMSRCSASAVAHNRLRNPNCVTFNLVRLQLESAGRLYIRKFSFHPRFSRCLRELVEISYVDSVGVSPNLV